MSFFKKAFKSIKSVTHSKLFTAGLGGLAVVFPVVGVPLVAGLAVANKVTDGLASADAKIRGQAQAVVKATVDLAKKGDVPAKRAVALMRIVDQTKKGDPAAKAKLGRLQLIEKTRQAKAKALVAQFALTRGGRIVHKRTKRNLAPAFR